MESPAVREVIAAFGIIGALLRAPLKYHSDIVLRGLSGAFNWALIMSRGLSLSGENSIKTWPTCELLNTEFIFFSFVTFRQIWLLPQISNWFPFLIMNEIDFSFWLVIKNLIVSTTIYQFSVYTNSVQSGKNYIKP